MKIPGKIFREYDIRGEADVDLSDDFVRALGRALATFLAPSGGTSKRNARIAVGRDCRLSSDRLLGALSEGLMASGAEVLDIGVGPSPLLYFSAHHLETDGAVMITGSHNPPADNGFKMMRGKATLFGEDIQALRRIIEKETWSDAGPGHRSSVDPRSDYVTAVKRGCALQGTPLGKVVVDAGNGAAGPLALRTLGALGIEVEPLHCEMDGRFPHHHPDPTVEDNLVDLRARVAAVSAPLGIAYDGDGDRIGVIDDQGAVIWGDKLMVLFARQVLADHPGAAIIGEVKCSQTLYDDIAAKGGRPIVNKTGHSLIKKRMKEEGALLAGEMSGHIFFADRYFGFDDAIYATARLVELVQRLGKTPRELLADLPETSATPELRIPCPDEVKFDVVARVLEHYRGRREVLDVDGARIDFGEGAWGLCRASNTGPVLVLRFEALTAERRDAIRAEVEGVVADARAELGAAERLVSEPA
jgi:phosphomannomutase/phosphoglucomutase